MGYKPTRQHVLAEIKEVPEYAGKLYSLIEEHLGTMRRDLAEDSDVGRVQFLLDQGVAPSYIIERIKGKW